MLDDLDRIMAEHELDWIVARGEGAHVASILYLCEGAKVGHVTVLKKRGEPPFCIVGAMERDEARKAGLRFAVPNDYGAAELAKLDAPPIEIATKLLVAVLEKHDVTGRVSFVGGGATEAVVPITMGVLKALPAITYAPELDLTAIARARVTKSEAELTRIRDVARRTEEVVTSTRRLLAGCRLDGRSLLRAGGEPLKVGHVKEHIALELARRGLDDGGQTIFAVGREAGFPHSRGDETTPIVTGRTIIFDIFPHEKGGGYHYDFTRTWWIGEVSDRVRDAFAAVLAAFEATSQAVRSGKRTADLDHLACDVLEAKGFVTKRKDPRTDVGYMHGLGHGVGIDIHERPSINTQPANKDVFEPGMVFTIEPGVYFPDEEIGVRIEDTFVVTATGVAETLSRFPTTPEVHVGN